MPHVRVLALLASLVVITSCNYLSRDGDDPSSDVTEDGFDDTTSDVRDVADDPSVDIVDDGADDPRVDTNLPDAEETGVDVVDDCGDGVCATDETSSCPSDCGIWGQSNWNQATWQ